MLPREKKKHHATGTQIKIQENNCQHIAITIRINHRAVHILLFSTDNTISNSYTGEYRQYSKQVLYNRVCLFLKRFLSHKCFNCYERKIAVGKGICYYEISGKKNLLFSKQHSFFIIRKLQHFIKNCHL